MKHTNNTTRPARISRRLWVGIKGNTRTVFRFAGEPTGEACPQFACAVGPFRTRRGADYLARHGGNGNPQIQCVRDAERLAAIHAGQSALCSAYSAHLDREIARGN